MAVGFSTCITKRQCIPLLHSLVVLQILFSPNSFDFFDEFDYGAIGYTIFYRGGLLILKHIYLPYDGTCTVRPAVLFS
jgi:hypothetical protein